MRWYADLSREAQKQLTRLSRDARQRITRAIDEFEEKDESQWRNIKELQGPEWKGRLRKKVGPYRIISRVPRSRHGGNLRHPSQVQRYLPLAMRQRGEF